MLVNSTAVTSGIAEYLSKELKPQYPTETVGNFMMGFSSALIRRRAEAVAKKLLSNPLVATLVLNQDGLIDLDELVEAAQESVPDSGVVVPIPLSGEIIFKKSDAPVLRQYIEHAMQKC